VMRLDLRHIFTIHGKESVAKPRMKRYVKKVK
jgi:hypothetical protein